MGAALGCVAVNLCECAACMACSCCASLISSTLSQAARFGHILIVLTTFTLAIILGASYPNDINGYNYYTKVDLTGGCNGEFLDNCIYRQLIYRASFSLFLLFAILALGTGLSDYLNRSFWLIKFAFAIGVFIAFWWVDNHTFNTWAEISRAVSFIWLIIQGLLMIDFSHDIHDILMNSSGNTNADGEDQSPYAKYLIVSLICFALGIVGIVFLFKDYTGCDIGMFFTILTLVVGVITTLISMLDSVGKGIFTPGFMFAYSVFLCWYALLSNPDSKCNPTSDFVGGTQNTAIIVISVVTIVILLYCVINGTKILNIFNPNGEGVMMSYTADSPQQRTEMANVLTGQSTNAKGYQNTTVTAQPASSGTTTDPENNTNDNAKSLLTSHDVDRYREEEKSSGTPHERAFFHVLLMLAVCYGAMILTDWGRNDGAPASYGSHTVSYESQWLKITSQWVMLILYFRVLQVAYQDNHTP